MLSRSLFDCQSLTCNVMIQVSQYISGIVNCVAKSLIPFLGLSVPVLVIVIVIVIVIGIGIVIVIQHRHTTLNTSIMKY